MKVIFRKFKTGEVIAIFPQEPGSLPSVCMTYMSVGDHGDATPAIVECTLAAKPNEYAALKRELETVGYKLDVRQRFSKYDGLRRAEKVNY